MVTYALTASGVGPAGFPTVLTRPVSAGGEVTLRPPGDAARLARVSPAEAVSVCATRGVVCSGGQPSDVRLGLATSADQGGARDRLAYLLSWGPSACAPAGGPYVPGHPGPARRYVCRTYVLVDAVSGAALLSFDEGTATTG